MSNLGEYQDLVTLAYSVGGVPRLIERIKADAVAEAAPALRLKWAVVGVVGTLGVGGACFYVWRRRSTAAAGKSAAVATKDRLRAPVDDQEASENRAADVDENPDDSGTGETR